MQTKEKEKELIEVLRAYRKAYPKSRQLLYYAQQLFDELCENDED